MRLCELKEKDVINICTCKKIGCVVDIEFDKKSLTIHFLFGFFQKTNWDTVWKVERQSMPSDIRYYQIYGDSYGKKAFFTSNTIPYNRKIQRLLREYWRKDFKK